VRFRAAGLAAIATLLAACGGTGQAGSRPPADTRPPATSTGTPPANTRPVTNLAGTPPPLAVINVSLATVWTQPRLARPVDAPSTTNPVDIPLWLSRMTTADRGWLVGRLQTQVAYGVDVSVLGHSGTWSKVAVHGQPSQLNPLGYPGWVPTRQLTGNRSLVAIRDHDPVAIVIGRTAWLRDPVTLAKRIQISFATRIWVVGGTPGHYLIATPNGGRLAIRTSAVARYRSVAAIPKPTGAMIVAAAKQFLGLPYLWAGTSGFGFDCSGLTYSVYRRFGITLARDADRQALQGIPVARSALRPGDLLFFAGPGGIGHIHHVAIYVGSGNMIESPNTGDVVKIAPISSLGSEYAGARRYL
jgi:gamma-D-glutamyl-L-lysine dipeptidyl-peptidase